MSDTRLSVRVNSSIKRQADSVFTALGMNMSTGINIFLARMARSRAIPFLAELGGDSLEGRMRESVNAEISAIAASDSPVALYGNVQNRPYLEYPDGRRVYDNGVSE